MKKIFIKLVLVISAIMMISSCIMSVSQAAGPTVEEENQFLETAFSIAGTIIDGVAGILLLPLKLFILIIGTCVRAIAGGIALIGGTTGGLSGAIDTLVISPEDILFNNILLTDVNIFNFDVEGPILTIRQNIAQWYYALRNLAIVILLAILVYVGIRMTLTTVAEEEAKYKKMLTDWIISFILIFILHYIIIFTLQINDGLVDVFKNSLANNSKFGDAVTDTFMTALDVRLTVGLGSSIVYVMLTAITLMFLIMYIKRMITVSFLVMIAPIVTITYSIDKMGDGKSQALNTWLKEFVYNILIQPFHCIIYLSFGVTATELMNGTLGSSILAIIILIFIFQAEKILKNIFGFQARSLSDSIAGAALVGAGLGLLRGNKKGGSSGGGSAKATGPVGDGGSVPNVQKAAQGYQGAMGAGNGGGPSPYNNSSNKSGIRKATGVIGHKVAGVGKGVWNKAGFTRTGIRNQIKAGGKIGMMMLGAATGDMKNAVAGYAVGGNIGTAAADKVDKNVVARRIKKNEDYFAQAYNDYADSNPSIDTTGQLRDKTEDILNSDPSSIQDQDKAYASYVYAMRDSYAYAGEENPDQKVLDTVRNIDQQRRISP